MEEVPRVTETPGADAVDLRGIADAVVMARLARVVAAASRYYPGDPEVVSTDDDVVDALVAHLRAHPEDAAAVLGGEVERKIRDTTNGDLWHSAISPAETDVPVARVIGPWREVPTSEETARG